MEKIRTRLKELSEQLAALANIDSDEITDAQVQEIETLSAEFDALNAKLAALEKASAAARTAATTSAGRQVAPTQVVQDVTAVQAQRDARTRLGGFNTLGDYLMAVKQHGISGRRAKEFENVAYEKSGEDGGFLVPEELGSEIQKKMSGDDSLLAKTQNFPISGNALSLPVNESSPWSGGVVAYWMGEGGSYTASKEVFGQCSLKLHKLGALVPMTDELLEDAVALEGFIRAAAPEAIVAKINSSIISGDGVAKPLGILNSPFKYKVSKESGQSADTIVAKNIINMYARLAAKARPGAVWLINQAAEAQLLQMKDDSGNFIYLTPGSQMNQTPYALLMGIPVIPMMGAMSALGDEGDIILANFKWYYTITKHAAVKASASSHLYFDKDITAFKFTTRVDGKTPFKSAMTTEKGSYSLSAFITLEDR